MREKQLRFIITFQSTLEAMEAETLFKQKRLPGRLIPVPREVKAGCGLAWMAQATDEAPLMEQMKASSVSYEATIRLWL